MNRDIENIGDDEDYSLLDCFGDFTDKEIIIICKGITKMINNNLTPKEATKQVMEQIDKKL